MFSAGRGHRFAPRHEVKQARLPVTGLHKPTQVGWRKVPNHRPHSVAANTNRSFSATPAARRPLGRGASLSFFNQPSNEDVSNMMTSLVRRSRLRTPQRCKECRKAFAGPVAYSRHKSPRGEVDRCLSGAALRRLGLRYGKERGRYHLLWYYLASPASVVPRDWPRRIGAEAM